MKKGFLLSLFTLGLLLTSCGGGDFSFVEGNENVLTPSLLANNISVLKEEINTVKVPEKINLANYDLLEDYTLVEDDYFSCGLVELQNRSGFSGFYSTISLKFIVNPQYKTEWLTYNVYTNNYTGYLLKLNYENENIWYDGFGNCLSQKVENAITDYAFVARNGLVYLALYSELGEVNYFEYSKNGTLKEVYLIPPQITQPSTDEYEGPKIGELLKVGFVDLTAYGLANYSIAYSVSGYATVYNGSQVVSTFNIEKEANIIGILDTYLIYQISLELPEDATDYTYFDNGRKYELITRRVNLNSGEKNTINIPAVFDEITPLHETDNSIIYSIATYQNITEKKILSPVYSRVVDKNLRLYDDVSGLRISRMVKICKNRYFDYETNILFNESFLPITYMKDVNPTYISAEKVFLTSYQGKYGLVNTDGIVVAENVYSTIYTSDAKNGYFIGVEDGDVYRINVKTSQRTNIGSNINKIGENIFTCIDTYGDNLIFSSEQDITSYHTNSSYHTSYFYKNEYLIEDTRYTLATYEYDFTGELSSIYTNTIAYDDSDIVCTTNGTNLIGSVDSGEEDNPVTLEDGENELHVIKRPNSSYIYTSFTSSAEGYYFIYTENDSSISFIKKRVFNSFTYEYDLEDVSFNSTSISTTDNHDYNRRYSVYFDSNAEYIIRFNENSYTDFITVSVEYSYGWNTSYPLIYNFEDNNRVTSIELPVVEKDSINTSFRMKLLTEKTGYYKFKLNDSRYSNALIYINNELYTQNTEFPVYKEIEYTIDVHFYTTPTSKVYFTFTRNTTKIPPSRGNSKAEAIELDYSTSYSTYDVFTYNSSYSYFKFVPSGIGGKYKFYARNEYGSSLSVNQVFVYNNTTGTGTNYYTYESSSFNLTSGQCAIVEVYTYSLSSNVFSSIDAYITSSSSASASESARSITVTSDGSYGDSISMSSSTSPAYFKITNDSYEDKILNFNSYIYSSTSSYNSYLTLSYYTEDSTVANTMTRTSTLSIGKGETIIVKVEFSYSYSYTFYLKFSTYISTGEEKYTIDLGSGTYKWQQQGDTFTSSNTNVSSSNCTMTLTALTDFDLTISYTVSSESSWDKFLVKKNSSSSYEINASGSTSSSKVISLVAGDILTFTYSKDSSGNSGSDQVIFTLYTN